MTELDSDTYTSIYINYQYIIHPQYLQLPFLGFKNHTEHSSYICQTL